MTISCEFSLIAKASGFRSSSSFDWHTALPQGQLALLPSILTMSSSRQVLTMSQETFSPLGSRVATMSQIFFLHSFRASFSAVSSGVSCRLTVPEGTACSAGGCAGLCEELSSASSMPGASTRIDAAIRLKKRLIFLRSRIERLDDGLAHFARADGAAAFLLDIGGAEALIEHAGDGPVDAVGG